MMLPSNHPSPPENVLVPPPLIIASATPDGPDPLHADYNLHPLLVSSLDHYVEHDDDERFHIR